MSPSLEKRYDFSLLSPSNVLSRVCFVFESAKLLFLIVSIIHIARTGEAFPPNFFHHLQLFLFIFIYVTDLFSFLFWFYVYNFKVGVGWLHFSSSLPPEFQLFAKTKRKTSLTVFLLSVCLML